jgi:hypothetical protein
MDFCRLNETLETIILSTRKRHRFMISINYMYKMFTYIFVFAYSVTGFLMALTPITPPGHDLGVRQCVRYFGVKTLQYFQIKCLR